MNSIITVLKAKNGEFGVLLLNWGTSPIQTNLNVLK